MNKKLKSLGYTLGVIIYIAITALYLFFIGLVTAKFHFDENHKLGVVELFVFIYTIVMVIIIYKVSQKATKIIEETDLDDSKKIIFYFLTPTIFSILLVIASIFSFIYVGFFFTIEYIVVMICLVIGASNIHKAGADSYYRKMQ